MLGAITKYVKDTSVLRRLLFAAATLPLDLPDLWGVAIEFATRRREERSIITPNEAKMLIENLQELDTAAFATDRHLLQELIESKMNKSKPLGVVLISSSEHFLICQSSLKLRRDRPSQVVIYHDDMRTAPDSHCHKFCTNPSCGFVQYYGYYTTGYGMPGMLFNSTWASLPYFVSSR